MTLLADVADIERQGERRDFTGTGLAKVLIRIIEGCSRRRDVVNNDDVRVTGETFRLLYKERTTDVFKAFDGIESFTVVGSYALLITEQIRYEADSATSGKDGGLLNLAEKRSHTIRAAGAGRDRRQYDFCAGRGLGIDESGNGFYPSRGLNFPAKLTLKAYEG